MSYKMSYFVVNILIWIGSLAGYVSI